MGEHWTVEASCVGVAQGWVISGEQVEAVGEKVFGSVGKTILRFESDDASQEEIGEVAVEGNLAEADNDADARESLDLVSQM